MAQPSECIEELEQTPLVLAIEQVPLVPAAESRPSGLHQRAIDIFEVLFYGATVVLALKICLADWEQDYCHLRLFLAYHSSYWEMPQFCAEEIGDEEEFAWWYRCFPTGLFASLVLTAPVMGLWRIPWATIATGSLVEGVVQGGERGYLEVAMLGQELYDLIQWPFHYCGKPRQQRILEVTQGMVSLQAYVVSYGICGWMMSNISLGLYAELQNVYLTPDWIIRFVLASQLLLINANLTLHRYFGHNCFETSRIFQFVLAAFSTLSFQRGPLWWAGVHRGHHVHCDLEEDPHSPHQDGFIYAHIGWLTRPKSFKIPFQNVTEHLQCPELILVEMLQMVIAIFLMEHLVAPILGDDVLVPALAWSLNGEWGINSICHIDSFAKIFGIKCEGDAEVSCHARDVWLLGILNGGEGFHGAHHDTPGCAHHGRRHWYNFDITFAVILAFEKVGLVWNVQHPGQSDTRKPRTAYVDLANSKDRYTY